ncbi:SHC2 protein, partial [Polypterus senegalus]
MLLKPKYDRFRNDSVTSSDDLMQSLAMSGKVAGTPVTSSVTPQTPSLIPLDRQDRRPGPPALADSPCTDQDVATTFCMLIPKMPQWKFANPSTFLGRGSGNKELGNKVGAGSPGAGTPSGSVSNPVASLAAVLNSCDPVCVTPCSLQAMNRLRSGGSSNSNMGTAGGEAPAPAPGSAGNTPTVGRWARVDGMRIGGEDFTHRGSFINKPSQGWLHPDKKILGSGAHYIVRTSRLDHLVTALEAANKTLQSIMGRSNLRFAGMSIVVNISVEGVRLMMPTTRQIIANHPMQSISFASGGDTDTPDYVAYVAKDPVNERACHILECYDGLAQSIISTIGQAFELQFKQYMHSPPKVINFLDRGITTEESAWGDDEDSSEHDYYNSIPGKEPPVGGLVDSRLRQPGHHLNHMLNHASKTPQFVSHSNKEMTQTLDQPCYDARREPDHPRGTGLTSDGYLRADGRPPGSCDYEEHLYVNTQNLDSEMAEGARDSPTKDLFDMRPFEDALKLHESGMVLGVGGECVCPPIEDQWPSPPRRRAPIAPTEDQLRHEPWYHGRMSRRDAEKLLVMDGDFLVRDSATNPGQCLRNPGAQHFRHTRKCSVEDDSGHPDGFRVRSRHFRHTGVWLGLIAGKQLEPIRVPIKGAVSLQSWARVGRKRTELRERGREAARKALNL